MKKSSRIRFGGVCDRKALQNETACVRRREFRDWASWDIWGWFLMMRGSVGLIWGFSYTEPCPRSIQHPA